MSVYAFSLDNYKRPAEEVALLMQLAEAKLTELLHVRTLRSPCCILRKCCVYLDEMLSTSASRRIIFNGAVVIIQPLLPAPP